MASSLFQLQLGRQDSRPFDTLLYWRDTTTDQIVDELIVPRNRGGCNIQAFAVSPSGNWIVTQRHTGQGQWGYDVLRSHPLERLAGIVERRGYMLDLPEFISDESYILGGYGDHWLGGWWAHPDDDRDVPARGGDINFGWLFKHRLPSHDVSWHELRVTVPTGWLPADPWDEIWVGSQSITPLQDGGVKMLLPGKIPFVFNGPLPESIRLPTPHPDGGKVL